MKRGSGLWDGVKEWLLALGRIALFVLLFLVLAAVGFAILKGAGDLESLFWQVVVTSLAGLGAGAVLMGLVEHRPAGALGIALTQRTAPEVGWGILLGGLGLAFCLLLLLLAGALRYQPEAGGVAGWLVTVLRSLGFFAVAALAEEALYRGYPFQVLVRAAGPVLATVIASGLFALAHAHNPHVGGFALANIFVAGVALSVAYLRTRSLWFATAVHLGWNWTMTTLFDLPVSGLRLFNTPMYDPVLRGSSTLTGGAFGPEGGLVGTVALLMTLLLVGRWPGLRPAARLRELGPLIDDHGKEEGDDG